MAADVGTEAVADDQTNTDGLREQVDAVARNWQCVVETLAIRLETAEGRLRELVGLEDRVRELEDRLAAAGVAFTTGYRQA